MTKVMMTKVINVVHVGSTSRLSSLRNMDFEVCSYADRNGVNDMIRWMAPFLLAKISWCI